VDGPEIHLAGALAGDPAATAALVRALAPVVEARVLRALLARGRSARGRAIRQEVGDLAQEALVELFAEGAKVLRGWDPSRGLTLAGYAGLVAERKVGHVLRSQRRSPWTEDPQAPEDLDVARESSGKIEARLADRQLMEGVYRRLRAELTPLGLELFQRLLVEERSVDELCAEMSMKPDAVYAWRSRLLKRARAIAVELSAPVSGPAGSRPSLQGRERGT
jgi:RNA polymerase sigma-70 factor (ECF subfamily)